MTGEDDDEARYRNWPRAIYVALAWVCIPPPALFVVLWCGILLHPLEAIISEFDQVPAPVIVLPLAALVLGGGFALDRILNERRKPARPSN